MEQFDNSHEFLALKMIENDFLTYCLQVGSEDALSSVDDLNVTEQQLSMKAHSLDQVSTLLYNLVYLLNTFVAK